MMPVIPPDEVAIIIKELIDAGASLITCKEQEKTKRAEIQAELKAKLTIINKSFDLYSKAFDNNHIETMELYDIYKDLLNQPGTGQNPELVKQIMAMLNNLHANVLANTSNNIAAIKGW